MAQIFNLSEIDGTNGFTVGWVFGAPYGAVSKFGYYVSAAGDFNGDGYADVFIGHDEYNLDGGASKPLIVVYGKPDAYDPFINGNDIDGSNGMAIIPQVNYSWVNSIASAGDINGDGYDDLIIGDKDAKYISNPVPGVNQGFEGRVYVVYGNSDGFASLQLTSGGGSIGRFSVWGQPYQFSYSGSIPVFPQSVSGVGDVNNDGIDDIVVGGQYYDLSSNIREVRSYIVYGSADLDEANGLNTFSATTLIRSYQNTDHIAMGPVSRAGDFNGDGIDDIALLEPLGAGEDAYIIFGGFYQSSIYLDDLDASLGIRIRGFDKNLGFSSISEAGDINGDGVDDIIIGAMNADPNAADAGQAYVVFGSDSGFPATIDLDSLDGTNGFIIRGFDAGGHIGFDVGGGGDVNGDGFDDLIVAGYDTGGGSVTAPAYVVFGRSGDFAPVFELSSLKTSVGRGLVINPDLGAGSKVTSAAFAGDVNGDGIDDIVVGTPFLSEAHVIFGDASFGYSDPIYGTLLADFLTGTDGPDAIFGLDGADLIEGGLQADTIDGGDGDDTIYAMTEADPGGSSVGDSLEGGDGNDLIVGAGGFDTLLGGAGDDYLEGGLSSDLIIGGAGNDILFSNTQASPTGSSYGDTLSGEDGDDIMIGAAGADHLLGGGDNDLINAGSGNDYVSGGAGNDDIRGDAGVDTISGGAGDDLMRGHDGNDRLYGDDGKDTILGGYGNDLVEGRNGDDFLKGDPGNDWLLGGEGNDSIQGGDDNDMLRGENGNDVLFGDNGQDTVEGAAGTDELRGGAGNDTLSGGDDGDLLFGWGEDDLLLGDAGNDFMKGDAGNDTLDGGAGVDSLQGNAGLDVYRFSPDGAIDYVGGFAGGAGASDQIELIGYGAAFDTYAEVMAAATQSGTRVIIDFGGGDQIHLLSTQLSSLNADDFLFG